MPLEESKTTKFIAVDIPDDVPEDIAADIRKDVGQYLVDAVLDRVGSGVSPVDGHGKWEQLSEPYAEREKGGRRLANLDLTGDMLNALKFKAADDGVEIGIWDAEEAQKSFGHNSGFKGHPILEGKAPMRRFIPDEDEEFDPAIQVGIREIVNQRVEEWRSTGQSTLTPDARDVNIVADRRDTEAILADLEDGTVGVGLTAPAPSQSNSMLDLSDLDETELDRLARRLAKRVK